MGQPTLEGLTLNAGSGGSTLAVETIGGKLWQAVLVGFSTGDGTADVVTADTPLPVTGPLTDDELRATAVPVSAAALPLPSGAATAARQDTGNAALATLASAVSGSIIAVGIVAQGGALAVSQSETWTVAIAASQTIAVTNAGTFAVQAAQSGTWTVGISGGQSIAATQSGTWTVAIAASQTIAVTNTGTFAVQAAQSGTWTVGISGGQSIAATQSGTWTVAIAASQTIAVTNTGTFAVQAAQSGSWTVAITIGGTAPALDSTNKVGVSAYGKSTAAGDTPLSVDSAGVVRVAPVEEATVLRFSLVCASSGANQLIAAVSGKKFLLRSIAVIPLGTAVNVYFDTKDDATTPFLGTKSANVITLDKTGATGPSGFVLNVNEDGWDLTSTVNKDLEINLSAAQAVAVFGTYRLK